MIKYLYKIGDRVRLNEGSVLYGLLPVNDIYTIESYNRLFSTLPSYTVILKNIGPVNISEENLTLVGIKTLEDDE